MRKVTKCIGTGVVCACAIVGISAGVFANSGPNAEIASAGAAEAVNGYIWSAKNEGDLLALIKPNVAASADSQKLSANAVYKSLAISVCNDYVNVRTGPGTNFDVVGVIENHCAATILGEENGWYKIESGNIVGYICKEYFVTGAEAEKLADEIGFTKATVNDGIDSLNVRVNPDTTSPVIAAIYPGESYKVIEESNGWVKIDFDGIDGWISGDYCKVGLKYDTALTMQELYKKEAEKLRLEEERNRAATAKLSSNDYSQYNQLRSASDYDVSSSMALRNSICSYASQFVGWLPYVGGGNSLKTGTDCSGFTSLVYAQFGIGLSRSASAQACNGYSVPYSDALPGDIIVYDGHVAIYAGGGMIYDEPVPGACCKYRSVNIMPICDVRRVI